MISKKLNEHEPAPIKNKFPAVWDLVYADIIERDKKGKEKYGTRLQPFNGRNVLIDAYQEALDLVVYLRQAIFEKDYKETVEEQKKQPSHFDNLLCDCPVCQVIAKGNKNLKEVILDRDILLKHPVNTDDIEIPNDRKIASVVVSSGYCGCSESKGIYYDYKQRIYRCQYCKGVIEEDDDDDDESSSSDECKLIVAEKEYCTCPGAVQTYLAADDIFRCRECEKKFDRNYRP